MRQLANIALDFLRSCVFFAAAFWIASTLGIALAATVPDVPELPPGTETYFVWRSAGLESAEWEVRNWTFGLPFLVLGLVFGAFAHVAVRAVERFGTSPTVASVTGGVVGAALPAVAFALLRLDVVIAWLAVVAGVVAGAAVGALLVPKRSGSAPVAA